ncbi:MAG: DUF1326 domain-containing protein [Myxococcales bacterium]|nr:DUF1326 domain-containing protein [Myxococcales bacterium]
MGTTSDTRSIEPWSVEGELVVNCNCDVFCPCVVSLGRAQPTQGYCQAFMATRVDSGHYGDTDVSDLTVVHLLDIPGRMSEGGWSVGLYVDQRADDDQAEALEQIFTGQAGGSSGLLTLLVANYLGMQRVPVSYEVDGNTRKINAGGKIVGGVEPIAGSVEGEPVTIENSPYWVSDRIVIGKGVKSKVRDFGRVWSLDGLSAEICSIHWTGP